MAQQPGLTVALHGASILWVELLVRDLVVHLHGGRPERPITPRRLAEWSCHREQLESCRFALHVAVDGGQATKPARATSADVHKQTAVEALPAPVQAPMGDGPAGVGNLFPDANP